jgi:hypothetical protein
MSVVEGFAGMCISNDRVCLIPFYPLTGNHIPLILPFAAL